MKLARYKSTEYQYTTVCEVLDSGQDYDKMFRISEILDVEFVDRPESELVPLEITALKKEVENAREAFENVRTTIDERIGKLLAITDQSGGAP